MIAVRRLVLALLLGLAGAPVAAGSASAHPLGNFTVNHYDGLRLFPDRVEDLAVIDTAEIPTLQQRGRIDRDGNGQLSDRELEQQATATCAALAGSIKASVHDEFLLWKVSGSTFGYAPGAAGLQVSRLECRLSAAARLNTEATLRFADAFQSDRVGWHEITAVGAGVHLQRSPVPEHSVSDELRHYPNDLLSSPLDLRSTQFQVRPGTGLSSSAGPLRLPVAGPLARRLDPLSRRFNDLVGTPTLTPTVGGLAVLLSLLLGASHAAMPGHGKTVIAAYLAGRQGSIRDALTVGATVTITHTAGVITLGLLLSGVAVLAGETVLAYLGVVSGLMIAGIGAWLLSSITRPHRREPVPATQSGHHEHDHDLEPGHEHAHGLQHDHGHQHGHSHGPWLRPSSAREGTPPGRPALVGLGVAGGLVPSPSALIVLLGAIGLGRTSFGILLVIGYGLGMAAMLTAVGLLLVRLRDRLDHSSRQRFAASGRRLAALTPILTAALVLLVGLGLALRAAAPLAF